MQLLPTGTRLRRFLGAAIAFATLIVVALVTASPASAQRATVRPLGGTTGGEMVVPINKSQLLRLDQAFTELSVGNPAIADVLAVTDRTIYVLGKALGSTRLSIYGANKEVLAIVDLVVTQDIGEIKRRLHELLPGEAVEVRAVNDSIMLSGRVSSAQQAARAAAVAETYAPKKVTNLMVVKGSQQVMLSVKVAEVARSVSKQLGLKPIFRLGGATNTNFTFNTLDTLDVTRFAATALHWGTGFITLDFLIDALEQKGVVKILAEPNLVALTGDTASFLAGGEFPIPVSQTTSSGLPTITIEFKQFGVSLAFTPTVIDGDLINLVVSPEVSQIDRTVSVQISGFTVPGLSTRRATTTVEVRDGQSFAIAGLLQNDITDQVRQIPGLGDVPILGALFRNSSFQRNETELVIFVTPRLVKPVPAGTIAAATDYFVPPSDVDLFLDGRIEAPNSGIVPEGPRQFLGKPAGGGIDGRYGHIIK
jgi:pilus assembly protein CpaC